MQNNFSYFGSETDRHMPVKLDSNWLNDIGGALISRLFSIFSSSSHLFICVEQFLAIVVVRHIGSMPSKLDANWPNAIGGAVI